MTGDEKPHGRPARHAHHPTPTVLPTSSGWTVTQYQDITLEDAIFIEGLPGIGNVGKVVVDFLIEQSGAEKFADFFSYHLPNSVFVTEDNLIELPRIEVYYAKIDGKDYLFMTGDVQPSDEVASFKFCEEILNCIQAWHATKIVTLGGVGLQEDPQEPVVYCTGNDEAFVKEFAQKGASTEVYGTVGPIIGVSGLLLGLAKRRDIPAAALLTETLGHPMYLGLRGAKAALTVLQGVMGFSYPLKDLEEEIAHQDDDEPSDDAAKEQKSPRRHKDITYIG